MPVTSLASCLLAVLWVTPVDDADEQARYIDGLFSRQLHELIIDEAEGFLSDFPGHERNAGIKGILDFRRSLCNHLEDAGNMKPTNHGRNAFLNERLREVYRERELIGLHTHHAGNSMPAGRLDQTSQLPHRNFLDGFIKTMRNDLDLFSERKRIPDVFSQ